MLVWSTKADTTEAKDAKSLYPSPKVSWSKELSSLQSNLIHVFLHADGIGHSYSATESCYYGIIQDSNHLVFLPIIRLPRMVRLPRWGPLALFFRKAMTHSLRIDGCADESTERGPFKVLVENWAGESEITVRITPRYIVTHQIMRRAREQVSEGEWVRYELFYLGFGFWD